MICPKCGFDNPGGSFCGKCGSPLPAQPAPVYQPPKPKRGTKKTMIVAIVAIFVVVAVVLAAIMFVLPNASQSSPEATMNTYIDGIKNHDAAQIVDSTVMHFDTANRSLLMNQLNNSLGNANMTNISIVSSEEISPSNVPTDIKMDVTNFTTNVQKQYSITVQESQFQKVTIKQTNSSTDSYTSTQYILFSKVDGKWYLDYYVSYSAADWSADRSLGDQGWDNFPGGDTTTDTPIGAFSGSNSSGYWVYTLSSIHPSTVKYTECKIQMSIGIHSSAFIAIPSSLHVLIPISAGTATGYELTIVDLGTSGYLSAGDQFRLGPIGNTTGTNANQPMGTTVTITVYMQTGGLIALDILTL